MPPVVQFRKIQAALTQKQPGLRLWTQSLLLTAGASLCLSTSASAAETITLTFDDAQVSVPVADIEAFAASSQVSGDLQTFFQSRPEVEQTARTVLTEEIRVSQSFIDRTLNSSTGEFVLIQLEKLLSSPSGQALQPLRTALTSAYEDDNKFSVLELLQDYPEDEIRVDLRGLERVYGDVSAFIERIQPALEVAREYIQDLVCECGSTPAASTPGSSSSPSSPQTGSPQSSIPTDSASPKLQAQTRCSTSQASTSAIARPSQSTEPAGAAPQATPVSPQ